MRTTLYVLRHAEAEAYLPGRRDLSRQLTERGREQAKAVAERLGGLLGGAGVDRVLCSPSVRTRQTLAPILDAGLVTGRVGYVEAVYDAGSDTLFELLGSIDDAAGTVLLVGHAPGVGALCWDLTDVQRSEQAAVEMLERGYPPATLARLGLDVAWSEVGPGVARLTDVVITR